MKGNEIMFTSNDTPESEFQEAYLAGAILNLDDITHIDRVQEALREDSLR
jgi:diaminopimelate decarboxylase